MIASSCEISVVWPISGLKTVAMDIPIVSLIICPAISIPVEHEPHGQPQHHPQHDFPQDEDRHVVLPGPEIDDGRQQGRDRDREADPETPREGGAPQDGQEREEHARPQEDHEEPGEVDGEDVGAGHAPTSRTSGDSR